jgi:hypothetical protein
MSMGVFELVGFFSSFHTLTHTIHVSLCRLDMKEARGDDEIRQGAR